MSDQSLNTNAPPLSDEDQGIIKLIQQANEQYTEYIKVTSFDLAELLAESDTPTEIPTYTWDVPLTLVVTTSS